MLDRKNCDPCSLELNQYESDIYTTLIEFFESLTCIPWIRGFSEASTPFDIRDINTNQQYGSLYIQSIDDQEVVSDGIVQVGEIERCRRIKTRSMVTVNVNVYNFSSGDGNTIIKSPADVLSSVRTLYKTLYDVHSNLCFNGINVHTFGIISNIAAMDAQDKYRAQQNMTFEIDRYTSIAETLLNKIKISLNCC